MPTDELNQANEVQAEQQLVAEDQDQQQDFSGSKGQEEVLSPELLFDNTSSQDDNQTSIFSLTPQRTTFIKSKVPSTSKHHHNNMSSAHVPGMSADGVIVTSDGISYRGSTEDNSTFELEMLRKKVRE